MHGVKQFCCLDHSYDSSWHLDQEMLIVSTLNCNWLDKRAFWQDKNTHLAVTWVGNFIQKHYAPTAAPFRYSRHLQQGNQRNQRNRQGSFTTGSFSEKICNCAIVCGITNVAKLFTVAESTREEAITWCRFPLVASEALHWRRRLRKKVHVT